LLSLKNFYKPKTYLWGLGEGKLKDYLIEIASRTIINNDPSHDILHALRVLKNCEIIAKEEGGDIEILIPGALFHDVVCYPKNHEKSNLSTIESANLTGEILRGVDFYPKNKIESVHSIICECSFSKGCKPSTLESKILQDADRLEATGCIAIMRTFASAGQMGNTFYNKNDPFCEKREPDSMNYALDLFYTRLLRVKDIMNTETAKVLAIKRTEDLEKFLDCLKGEIS
jgi:uncharacterized protein